jgi:hypothetical protein
MTSCILYTGIREAELMDTSTLAIDKRVIAMVPIAGESELIELDASNACRTSFPPTENPSSISHLLQQSVPNTKFLGNNLFKITLTPILLDHLLHDTTFKSGPI